MKFNKHLPKWHEEFLEKEYKKYCNETPMTNSERRALRNWVKDGNSVYENPSGVWADGQVPVEFLTVYRDEEYIRQSTKGMFPEEAKKFALDFYGWSDDISETDQIIFNTETDDICRIYSVNVSDDELPFN